jgi:hypothetical protein
MSDGALKRQIAITFRTYSKYPIGGRTPISFFGSIAKSSRNETLLFACFGTKAAAPVAKSESKMKRIMIDVNVFLLVCTLYSVLCNC